MFEQKVIRERYDERGRCYYGLYSDGYEFERIWDDSYKGGEVPYYAIERMHGKRTYEREGDKVLFKLSPSQFV